MEQSLGYEEDAHKQMYPMNSLGPFALRFEAKYAMCGMLIHREQNMENLM